MNLRRFTERRLSLRLKYAPENRPKTGAFVFLLGSDRKRACGTEDGKPQKSTNSWHRVFGHTHHGSHLLFDPIVRNLIPD